MGLSKKSWALRGSPIRRSAQLATPWAALCQAAVGGSKPAFPCPVAGDVSQVLKSGLVNNVIIVVVTSFWPNYSCRMIELIRSSLFDGWLSGLRDRRAKVRIAARLDRLAVGNPGDVKPVGGGISELRINYGPGYRVYYMTRGKVLIVLLCGGDKSTQDVDIKQAKALADHWKD